MQYDVMAKLLLEIGKDAILTVFYGLRITKSTIIYDVPKEMVSARSSDFVIRVKDSLDGEYIKLLELQTNWKDEKLVSIIQYTARLKNTYKGLEIRPAMLLFKEHKDATDSYSDNALTLKMRLVKLWTVKAWRYITDAVELMPFIPLMENGLEYVRRAEKRIYESNFERELKADLLTALCIFTGMRSKKLAGKLLKRRRDIMIESAAYDLIKDDGIVEGILEGKIEVARNLVEAGYPMVKISKVTGLKLQELREHGVSSLR